LIDREPVDQQVGCPRGGAHDDDAPDRQARASGGQAGNRGHGDDGDEAVGRRSMKAAERQVQIGSGG
jgi:hypothetical protein